MSRAMRKHIILIAIFFAAAFFVSLPLRTQAQTQQAQSQQQAVAQSDSHGTGIVPPGVKLAPQMPPVGAPRPFHFPSAETQTLGNGLRVFVVTDHSEPAVAVRLVILSAGTIHDPPGMPGVANMTADMLTQGTTTRSAQQFAQAIDFVGGHIDAAAGDDASYATLDVVSRDTDLGMDLLSDAVLHPAFAGDELDRQRQQALSSLRVEYSDPGFLASSAFSRVVFGASPYGMPGEGTPETVGKITSADLVKFHDANYAPNDALLAFAGDITSAEAFALAQKYFGSWPKKELPEEELAAPQPVSGLHFIVVDKPDAVQTQIRVGKLGIRRNDPDYVPLLVTNRIFGGGFNSRLNTEVRVKKGLTYGASSSFDTNRFAGAFVAGTFTRTEKTVEATQLVVNLIAKMSTGDISPDELKFAQDYLSGVFPIQSETAEEVASHVLTVAEYGLPPNYNDTFQKQIRDVSESDVNRMAKQYFDAHDLDVVLVGNAAKFLDGLKAAFPDAKWDEILFSQFDLLAPDLRQPNTEANASPESLARGHEILMEAAKAAGGDALRSVTGIEFVEKLNAFSPQGVMAISAKWQVEYPDKVHAELTLPMATILQITDGKSAWIQSPQGVSDATAFLGDFERGIQLFGGWGLYQQALAGTAKAEYMGQEQIDGMQADAVDWFAPFGTIKLYFDSSSHYLIAAKFKASMGPQQKADEDEHWSDFRNVEGRVFPFQTVLNRDGAKFSDSTVQDLHVNPALDPSLFQKPGPPPAPQQP
jgi:zinc protease